MVTEEHLDPCRGYLFSNPGTGPVKCSRRDFADKNIAQLVQDVGLEGITIKKKRKDYDDGRYAYKLSRKGMEVEVHMPGWPLEDVRYLGGGGQNPFNFPRLYVDDNSYLWKFAISNIKETLEEFEQK